MKKFKRIVSNLYIGRTLILFLIFVLISFLSNKNINIPWIACEVYLCKFVVSIILLILLLIAYIIKTPEKSISIIIKNLISGKIYGLYGIFGLVFTVSILGWFADSIFSLESFKISEIIYPFIILINLFVFGLTFLIFYPKSKKRHKNNEPEKRKVLIMALSVWGGLTVPENNELVRKILQSDCVDVYPSGDCGKLGKFKNGQFSWQLPLRALKHHAPVLEKAIFLVSEKSDEQWDKFLSFVKILNPEFVSKLEKTKPLNFNDTDEISDELKKLLKSLSRDGYKDEDISVNISGGTSAVTLCLTLFAIEEKRQIEYFTQFETPAKHKMFNVSKEDAITFLKSLTFD